MIELNSATLAAGGLVERLDEEIQKAVANCLDVNTEAKKTRTVVLRPYRTFTEVEQPASAFIFRCRQDQGKMQFMLCEADGGAWRSEAMKNIQTFMEKAVQGLNVIA